MATRKDVAIEAGVSTACVSYYVNKSGYVSEETAKKIQKAIDKLDYQPNLIAKSLKMKDSKQFVFLCNEIRNPFHAELAYNATRAAYDCGYMTLFSNAIDDSNYHKTICSYNVSGMFFASTKIDLQSINDMAEKKMPIVLLDDMNLIGIDERVMRITIVFERVMEEMVEHLLEKRKLNIAYISGVSTSQVNKQDGKTQALLRALANKRIEMKPEFLVSKIISSRDAYKYVTENYAELKEKPNAYICTNDAVAMGVLRAVHEMGQKVPEDVVVIGFDDTATAKITIPSLTSVNIGTERLGQIAIDMLVRKCRGEQVADVKIIPELKIRESTGY